MKRSIAVLLLGAACALGQPKLSPEKEAAMKADLAGQIDAMKKQAQVMVDSVFSFGELGFQEIRDLEIPDRRRWKRKVSRSSAITPASRPPG